MTLRNLYRPTHYDQPLPRGWLVLCASTLAWLMFWGLGLGYGLWLVLRAFVGLS